MRSASECTPHFMWVGCRLQCYANNNLKQMNNFLICAYMRSSPVVRSPAKRQLIISIQKWKQLQTTTLWQSKKCLNITLVSGVILNPAFKDLMILFLTNNIMHISKDFQLYYLSNQSHFWFKHALNFFWEEQLKTGGSADFLELQTGISAGWEESPRRKDREKRNKKSQG